MKVTDANAATNKHVRPTCYLSPINIHGSGIYYDYDNICSVYNWNGIEGKKGMNNI